MKEAIFFFNSLNADINLYRSLLLFFNFKVLFKFIQLQTCHVFRGTHFEEERLNLHYCQSLISFLSWILSPFRITLSQNVKVGRGYCS